MNFARYTANIRLLSAILIGLLSVVMLESVVVGDLLVAPKGGLGRANPAGIRFTQDTVSPNFSKGGTLTDAVNGLRRGTLSADDFPTIRVGEHNGKLYSLDNRRLSAFKAAQLDDIPIQRLHLSDPAVKAEFLKKFRPINDGLNNVMVPSKGRAEARRILREFGKYDSN